MNTVLFNANELAKQLLPGSEFDADNALAIAHVSAAIENLAEWKSLNSTSARIDLDAIVREVREMNMSWQSKDAIVGALQTSRTLPLPASGRFQSSDSMNPASCAWSRDVCQPTS